MIKAILAMAVALAASAFAEHVPVPFDGKKVKGDIQDTRLSTVALMETLPVLVDGRPTCAYLGSIATPPDSDLTCPQVAIYHLVRISGNRGKLSCYYDYNRDYSYVLSISRVDGCPDILASYSGFRFFDAVNFDAVDDHRLYYVGTEIPRQSIDWSLSDDYRVRDQVLYRRLNFPSAKAKRHSIEW